MNEKVKTSLGFAVIFVILATIIFFTWTFQKNKGSDFGVQPQAVIPKAEKINETVASAIEGWQTYRDENHGFELQYPKDWKASLPEGDGFALYLVSHETEAKLNEMGEYPSADVMVFYYKSVACMEPGCANREKKLFNFLQSRKASGINGEVRSVNVNGIDGYETVNFGMLGYYTLYLEKPSGIYQVLFNLRSSKSELTTDENKILSTFKFTK